MVELQHYEANAATNSMNNLDSLGRPGTAMPTNTRLQVAVVPDNDEVATIKILVYTYL